MEPESFILVHVLSTLKVHSAHVHMYVIGIHNIAGFNSTTTSTFLKRAELSRKGSQVTLRCEFADKYPGASCVLVYRKYNNPHLTVKEYSRSTEFPIPVKDTENYTFAVFGKNGKKIEKEPVTLLKKEEHVTYPPRTCKNLYPSAVIFRVILWVIEYIRTSGVYMYTAPYVYIRILPII